MTLELSLRQAHCLLSVYHFTPTDLPGPLRGWARPNFL